MPRQRILNILVQIILISAVWGGFAAALIINERYWWSIIPIMLLLLSLRSIYMYYMKTHPELIEADEMASKGFTKIAFIVMFGLALVIAILHSFGAPEAILSLIMWSAMLTFLIYLYMRQRRFRREARKKLDEHEKAQEISL